MAWTKRKKIYTILLSLLVLLVVARLILPYVVLRYVNKTLAEMRGYYGHVEDIDIALLRGAYKIDSVYLNKLDTVTQRQTPFFSAGEIDLSVEWKALFKGELVGEMIFERPVLLFTRDKAELNQVRKDSSEFKELQDDVMPLRVNRVEINNGTIGYRDNFSKPKVDVRLTNAYILALNLRNSYDSATLLPSTIRATAKIYDGTLVLNAKLNPLAEQPTFDLNAEVKNTNLVKLNDFFQAYAKIDVNKGRFGLYTEVAAKEGNFTGYVKPLIQDLDVLGPEDKKDNVLRKIWEAVAGTVGEIFENQKEDQVATKISFQGKLKDPSTNVWLAITRVLQNAFIKALQPSIDQEINIAQVDAPKKEKKTFLEKVFGSNKDKKKNRKKEKEKEKAKS